ncbi:hypothetical protein RS9916_30524 [Synechococcus sp. RS9916]|nr:hypothetical protein RS9916_30524 [Synechococcus sp. RS9916]
MPEVSDSLIHPPQARKPEEDHWLAGSGRALPLGNVPGVGD